MQENNFNNIQEFENNYELRKALNKLENELQKKDYELNLITNLYQDLKLLNEKARKECDDLNIKLNTVRVDMRNMEKNYQSEIETMKLNHSKETEIYNNKILKLSEYNPANLQKNIEYKIENKFKQNMSLILLFLCEFDYLYNYLDLPFFVQDHMCIKVNYALKNFLFFSFLFFYFVPPFLNKEFYDIIFCNNL